MTTLILFFSQLLDIEYIEKHMIFKIYILDKSKLNIDWDCNVLAPQS